MLKRSRVFRCDPLFCSCNISIMLWMGAEGVCVWSIRCLAKFEERLAFFVFSEPCGAARPVCPTYAFPQSGHINL